MLQADGDGAVGGREFHGVGEEVGDHLLHAVGIEGGREILGGQRQVNGDLLGVGGRTGGIDGRFYDGAQCGLHELEAHLAGGDAGDVEEVFDQFGLDAGVAVDDI